MTRMQLKKKTEVKVMMRRELKIPRILDFYANCKGTVKKCKIQDGSKLSGRIKRIFWVYGA